MVEYQQPIEEQADTDLRKQAHSAREQGREYTMTDTRAKLRPVDSRRTVLVVEDEAVYLFYRETAQTKNPGITVFRIGTDGTYDVSYPDEGSAIRDNAAVTTATREYFSADGKQLKQPQKGLNIVRQSDGTVKKTMRF